MTDRGKQHITALLVMGCREYEYDMATALVVDIKDRA